MPAMEYINMSVSPQSIRIIIQSKDPAQIRDLMDALERQYETYPGMRAFAARGSIISSNDGGTRSVNLNISDPDLVALYAVAQAAFSRAETVFDNPRVQSQPSSLSLAHPLLQIKPDFDRVAEVGMTNADPGGRNAAAVRTGHDRKDGGYLHSQHYSIPLGHTGNWRCQGP
mgnify:FL=1